MLFAVYCQLPAAAAGFVMRQIVLRRPGEFASEQVTAPKAAAGEALVRVHRVGVCGTDLHAFAGRQPFFSYPRVLGHELGVEVVEAPAGNHPVRSGDHCAVEPYLNCGHCQPCLRGAYNCCENLQVLGVQRDGGMCELLSVPIHKLHKSDRLSIDQLALVETLGIGAHAVERSGLQSGESALVIGAGPIGLAVLQFAIATKGSVRVIELNDARRTFVDRLGVEVMSQFDGQAAHVVFDATGSAASMQAAFNYVAHGGRLVFVGLVKDAITFDDPSFHRREITLLASRNSCDAFPRIIQMIEGGQIDTTPWITHRLELGEVPSRFPALAGEPGLVKAMIHVGS